MAHPDVIRELAALLVKHVPRQRLAALMDEAAKVDPRGNQSYKETMDALLVTINKEFLAKGRNV